MKSMLIKRNMLLLATVLTFFSCVSKEEKVKEYVEQNIVSQVEDYMICQAIMNYAKTEAQDVFISRINYYVNNPYYDYSYIEKDLGEPFMTLASASGSIKQKFDKRWDELSRLYNMLSYEGNVEYQMYQIDSTLTFRDLLKETEYYSIGDIADIYFKPNHLKFSEITPELHRKIYRSMLVLGAKTYKYDVVDEIRVKKKGENLWTVDLVYHSGDCMAIEVGYNKENGFFVSKAPWLPEVWGDEDDLWGDEKPQE